MGTLGLRNEFLGSIACFWMDGEFGAQRFGLRGCCMVFFFFFFGEGLPPVGFSGTRWVVFAGSKGVVVAKYLMVDLAVFWI